MESLMNISVISENDLNCLTYGLGAEQQTNPIRADSQYLFYVVT